MSANGSSEAGCRYQIRASNITHNLKDQSITTSIISMTTGILSNSLALFILLKSYHAIRIKSKAPFLLFASSLVITDLLGHLINGSLLMFVHGSHRRWESFDPHCVLCSFYGACMVFFGLSPLFLSSAMAVERCVGVTRPLFHSTALVSRHMKRLLGLIWLFAALVAILPVLLSRPYHVQPSGSWCFFQIGKPRDWLDRFLPVVFSVLGLLALLLSMVFNTLTSCFLLQGRLFRKHHLRGTSYHLEMICQLLAIMVVCCICWGPLLIHIFILSVRGEGEPSSSSLLLVRMATWNQILDPWVYILLRKAVLRKLFLLLHTCQLPKAPDLHRLKSSVLQGSLVASSTAIGPPDFYFCQSPPSSSSREARGAACDLRYLLGTMREMGRGRGEAKKFVEIESLQ